MHIPAYLERELQSESVSNCEPECNALRIIELLVSSSCKGDTYNIASVNKHYTIALV